MKYQTINEVLKSINEDDFEEVSCKLGLHFHDIENIDEAVEALSKNILESAEILLKPYSKDTLKYLYELCLSDSKSMLFDMEYNVLICDGICYLEKENNVEYIKVTEDIANKFKELYERKDTQENIDKYDETETVVEGIIKTYGIISSDSIYDIFMQEKNKDEEEFLDINEFEHFLFHRDNIIKKYDVFNHHDEEFFYIEEIEDPDEVIHELMHQDEEYKIFDRKAYIEFSKGSNFVTDEKIFRDFKEYIHKLTDDNERQTEDIVNTVMYDIKLGNLDDLMLDIMTYVSIGTNEEHEEIKQKLSDLYENTPTWFGRYVTNK